jgi:lipopolysaccharide transport system ATP-binding protein
MQPIIVADHLGKQYEIAHQRAYRTLRDSLIAPFARLGRRGSSGATKETIWALKDVSFELAPGEVVGVIGRNGAGKSTLLKILSRVTLPTAGEVRLHGRVGSLLEVGSGFHPELTGRENVYLNGAILGMRAREIAARFDEIVAFAGVEKFVDTPVKHYSSGMYLRLAFAVAAHLDTEILLMDEVLAVGDMSFQRKCLAKMEDVGRSGRTVVFVSHNVQAVTRLCERTILIKEGSVAADGPSADVVGAYLRSDVGTTAHREWDMASAPGNHIVRLTAVRVRNDEGQIAQAVDIRRRVGIEVEFIVLEDGHTLTPNLQFFTQDGTCAFVSVETDSPWRREHRVAGRYVSIAWIPGNFLAEGTTIVGAAVTTFDPIMVHAHERDAVAFEVVDSIAGDTARGDYGGAVPGVVRPMLRWETLCCPDARKPAPLAGSFQR